MAGSCEVWGVPIHQTHVGQLFRSFVTLCNLARGDEEQVRQRLLRQGGIYLMVDGVQFDDRSPVLYLCWDAKSGTPLFGERLTARDGHTLSNLLHRVKRLEVPVRGIITDAEKGLVPAVAAVFPEVPHQLCHMLTLVRNRCYSLKNAAPVSCVMARTAGDGLGLRLFEELGTRRRSGTAAAASAPGERQWKRLKRGRRAERG